MFGLVKKKKYEKLERDCIDLQHKLIDQIERNKTNQSFINDLLTSNDKLHLLLDPLYNQEITLENTKGIREQKKKDGTYSFQSYISVNSGEKQKFITIGSYPTIQEAYQARLDFINDLK